LNLFVYSEVLQQCWLAISKTSGLVKLQPLQGFLNIFFENCLNGTDPGDKH